MHNLTPASRRHHTQSATEDPGGVERCFHDAEHGAGELFAEGGDEGVCAETGDEEGIVVGSEGVGDDGADGRGGGEDAVEVAFDG